MDEGLDPVYRDLMLIAKTPSILDFSRSTIEAAEATIEQRSIRSTYIDFLKARAYGPSKRGDLMFSCLIFVRSLMPQ